VQGETNDGRLGGIADAVGGGDEKPLFVLHIGPSGDMTGMWRCGKHGAFRVIPPFRWQLPP